VRTKRRGFVRHVGRAAAHPQSSLCRLRSPELLCSAPRPAVGRRDGDADGGRQLQSSPPPAVVPPRPQGDSFPPTPPSRCCSLCSTRKKKCFQRWDGRLVCQPRRSRPRWRAEEGLGGQAKPFFPGLAGSLPFLPGSLLQALAVPALGRSGRSLRPRHKRMTPGELHLRPHPLPQRQEEMVAVTLRQASRKRTRRGRRQEPFPPCLSSGRIAAQRRVKLSQGMRSNCSQLLGHEEQQRPPETCNHPQGLRALGQDAALCSSPPQLSGSSQQYGVLWGGFGALWGVCGAL